MLLESTWLLWRASWIAMLYCCFLIELGLSSAILVQHEVVWTLHAQTFWLLLQHLQLLHQISAHICREFQVNMQIWTSFMWKTKPETFIWELFLNWKLYRFDIYIYILDEKQFLKNSYQIGLKFLRYVGISSYHAEKRVLRKLATVGFLFDWGLSL